MLPTVQMRWRMRQRPLPPQLTWAQERYTAVLAADGSTLDALLRKVGLLRGQKHHPLAGKMLVLLDVCSWLPLKFWLHEDAKIHDQRFWPQLPESVPEGALLLFDLGFTNYEAFAQAQHFTFVTRLKEKLSFQITHRYCDSSQVKDWVGWIGSGKKRLRMRVVKVYFEGEWYAFLSNELDPNVLPVLYLVALYFQRWRIDIAFREDDCRVRKGNGAENFAVLRHIALNLLKQEKSLKCGIKVKMAGWDHNYLLRVLTVQMR